MSTLFQIHGAGGSGKSTLVKRVAEHFPVVNPIHLPNPFVYDTLKKGRVAFEYPASTRDGGLRTFGDVRRRANGRGIATVGRYDNACGGCDTIVDIDMVYAIAELQLAAGLDAIVEGKLVTAGDMRRPLQLTALRMFRLLVIQLTTSMEECWEAINERRAAAGKEPFNRQRDTKSWENLLKTWEGGKANSYRIAAQGAEVIYATRQEAYMIMCERLGVTP